MPMLRCSSWQCTKPVLRRSRPSSSKLQQLRTSSTLTSSRPDYLAHVSPGTPITVALSGGVDSSVTAALLLDADVGPVRGMFMKSWDTADEDGKRGCEWEKDWEDVRVVARHLGLPVEMVDLSREYWHLVWEPSLRVWDSGGTPNADVLCNRHIKFGSFADHVFSRHPNSYLATGHYARLLRSPFSSTHTKPGIVSLLRAVDHRKDQSYYLATSPMANLSRTILPLGGMHKSAVRRIAQERGLHNAQREESMGVCFVEPRGRFSHFLESHLPCKPGPIVDTSGRRLGTHEGLWQYTIGERCRGVQGMPAKMFVARKDVEGNALILVPGSTHPDLYCSQFMISDFHWLHGQPPTVQELWSGSLSVRLRTGEPEATLSVVELDRNGQMKVVLSEKQHGVSPGQVAVLHRGEEVLGGGEISATCPV